MLVPVRTNVRTFHPSFPWSRDVGFGAGMIATAHAFRARVSAVLLASGGYPGLMPPHASHPDIDPLFSSGALAVTHAQPDLTRLGKVSVIASRPEAMSVLEVCLHHDVPASGVVNCGRCEKCVRTQLAFAAIGCLDAAVTFPDRGRLAEHLREVRISGVHAINYAAELVSGLAATGRPDLADLLRRKIAAAERQIRRRGRWWRRLARSARRRNS